jgi:apolipoprotein N-acyltransferase
VLRREVSDVRGYVYFNSALLSDQPGHVCDGCRYDKQYLLAFGEYLPFGDTFPILYQWSPNSGKFTPGKSLRPLPLGSHEIATFICYEDIIPAFVNSIVAHGRPDLLVNMTNDAWFGDSTEPWIHLALSKFRAIEHRRYLVRSTNSGVSGVIDPVGRVVVHSGTFRQEALISNIAWLRASTPFELLGNVPWWACAVLVFAAGFVGPPGSRAGKSKAKPRSPD